MLGDITAADEIYIVTGLSSRYFYPHLFWQQSFFFVFSSKR